MQAQPDPNAYRLEEALELLLPDLWQRLLEMRLVLSESRAVSRTKISELGASNEANKRRRLTPEERQAHEALLHEQCEASGDYTQAKGAVERACSRLLSAAIDRLRSGEWIAWYKAEDRVVVVPRSVWFDASPSSASALDPNFRLRVRGIYPPLNDKVGTIIVAGQAPFLRNYRIRAGAADDKLLVRVRNLLLAAHPNDPSAELRKHGGITAVAQRLHAAHPELNAEVSSIKRVLQEIKKEP